MSEQLTPDKQDKKRVDYWECTGCGQSTAPWERGCYICDMMGIPHKMLEGRYEN